jgi:hypothetical protein
MAVAILDFSQKISKQKKFGADVESDLTVSSS